VLTPYSSNFTGHFNFIESVPASSISDEKEKVKAHQIGEEKKKQKQSPEINI
jgi:hypothetical protein